MEEKKEEHTHHHDQHGHQQDHHAHQKNHVHHGAHKKKQDFVLISLLAILGIILLVNIFFTLGINKTLNSNIEAAREAARPGKIEITLIDDSTCADCSDISEVVQYVKSIKSNVTKEKTLEFSSSEAKELISKYQIRRIPVVLVTGELNKISIEGFETKSNALVFAEAPAPYVDAATGKVRGRVSLTLLKDKSCEKCNDLKLLINQMKFSGIKIAEEKNVTIDSIGGQELAEKYKINFVPTLILSQDAADYPIIQQAWPQIGTKEKDSSYVLRLVYPPYINLTTGDLKGLIDVVYLNDSGCEKCYDVSLHRQILTSPQSFAMTFDTEEIVDISSAKGKELISKYNITKVPTVILSEEANAYPAIQAVRQFYSKEKDNSYVFRSLQAVGAYKDLSTNAVVEPQVVPQ